MTARVVLAAALLLASGNAGLLADEPVRALLVIPDSRILPGVPFDFWIEVDNRSDRTRQVTICAPFEMRLVTGEPFDWIDTGDLSDPSARRFVGGADFFLGPGQTTLAVPASKGLRFPGLFRSPAFSAPGRRFALTLRLCERAFYGARSSSTPLTTTPAEIEIMTPTGSDADVWKFIQETSGHQWTPEDMYSPKWREMWQSILRDYPASNYVPYAVLKAAVYGVDDHSEALARILRTIARFPDSPVLEWLVVEAWWKARSIDHGVMLAERAVLRRSSRPTTHQLVAERQP